MEDVAKDVVPEHRAPKGDSCEEHASPPAAKIQWEVPVDAHLRCTEFKPFRFWRFVPWPHCGRRRETNPHMRAFWAATSAFCFAFLGWFAFAPLMAVVRVDLGLCDNDDELQSLPEADRIDACICAEQCLQTIRQASVAAVSFDVFTRFLLAILIERLGPVRTDCLLLLFGALCVGASAAIQDGVQLIVVRFFVSCLGSTFVVNQFWNSIMFSKNVIGTANATAGGWGNLGGGLTQLLMPLLYKLIHEVFGCSLRLSWRLTMMFPASLLTGLAGWIFFFSQDTATGNFHVGMMGKKKRVGLCDYARVIADYRVFLMIFQYSACFGTELVLNNLLAQHFKDTFGMSLLVSGAFAMCFGGMNLFARSLGGIISDMANQHRAMQGRLWAHFVSLLGQSIFLFFFGRITKDVGGWPVALVCLVLLSIFTNMAEGTSFAIVPYMIPTELAAVSAVVGAGGSLGAVIISSCFHLSGRNQLEIEMSFTLHALYVLFWALTVLIMQWDELGSMFRQPRPQSDGDAA